MGHTIVGRLLALALAGCGSEYDVAITPLAGTVDGQPWTFVAGDTDAFLSEGEDEFFALLYPEAFTACGFGGPSGKHLIVAVPKAVGEYDLSLSRNMTFVIPPSTNLIATRGTIVVDEVTATLVRGGLHGVHDDDNQVNGRFELTVCTDPP